jgi:hypothetical protein
LSLDLDVRDIAGLCELFEGGVLGEGEPVVEACVKLEVVVLELWVGKGFTGEQEILQEAVVELGLGKTGVFTFGPDDLRNLVNECWSLDGLKEVEGLWEEMAIALRERESLSLDESCACGFVLCLLLGSPVSAMSSPFARIVTVLSRSVSTGHHNGKAAIWIVAGWLIEHRAPVSSGQICRMKLLR